MKSMFLRSLAVCLLVPAVSALIASPAGAQEDTRALPAGVRAEQVTFSSSGMRFAGRLLLPKLAAGKRAPGLLLLSGSNLRSAGSVIAAAPVRAFAELAAAMSASGMAVLSFDTQCNGASECKRDATPQEYAIDASAAFQYLARRPEVDASKIMVLGHDEGGTFAASIAGNPLPTNAKLVGVILVNVPGRTYGKLIRDGAEKRLKAAGKTPEEIKAYLQQFDTLAFMLSSGNVDFKAAKADEKDPLLNQFLLHRQYLFHLFVNDPLQVARGIDVPVLIIQGEKDAQVGVRDAQYLKESVDRQYHKDATLEVLPEMDHWMRQQKASVPYRDEESSGVLDPALTSLLNAWISKRLK